ncbi:hypothetical protein CDAR_177481 [Caerostris darwini]|uniref:Uncharacterized protein n=1 Tax=Caerostris darwini TaxID=1538125 RepID=A0AAV4P1P3_9ARAC|nr:hypothetical protein CDAR_177481 [Caerostris darwini]
MHPTPSPTDRSPTQYPYPFLLFSSFQIGKQRLATLYASNSIANRSKPNSISLPFSAFFFSSFQIGKQRLATLYASNSIANRSKPNSISLPFFCFFFHRFKLGSRDWRLYMHPTPSPTDRNPTQYPYPFSAFFHRFKLGSRDWRLYMHPTPSPTDRSPTQYPYPFSHPWEGRDSFGNRLNHHLAADPSHRNPPLFITLQWRELFGVILFYLFRCFFFRDSL